MSRDALSRDGGTGAPRPSALAIDVEQANGGVCLKVRGDLDLSTAPELERAVARSQRGHPKRLVLDLTGISFLDSCGLRALLVAQRECARAECELALIAGEQARRLFDLTGVTDRLPLADSTSALDGASGG
jgi:anti-sigma B factor antagonist